MDQAFARSYDYARGNGVPQHEQHHRRPDRGALNILAQAKAALGSLERVVQVMRLNGFVASTPESGDQPKVVNGASDLMVAVLGDAGRHTRVAVGVASLPANCAVEIDAVIRIKP